MSFFVLLFGRPNNPTLNGYPIDREYESPHLLHGWNATVLRAIFEAAAACTRLLQE